mmetsp:Transcript_10720/g.29538  ORF Transcript_10720/g.29538 Transcript_10720/m.29538 type:complete len:422 (-) Transcript_10720:184-1449(-)
MTAPKNAADKAKERKNGLEWTKKKIETMFEKSRVVDKSGDLPAFDYDEVDLGKVLGKGGFGTVSEVRSFKVKGVSQANRFKASRRNLMGDHQDDAKVNEGEMESRHFIAEHCVRASGDARYALKILSPEVVKDTAQFLQGVIDMAVETRVLSDIEHPNIIKLRALAMVEPQNEKYFIVMDRLYDTLEHRLKTWEKNLKKQKGLLRDRSGKKLKELYEERIVVAYDLASAVEYIHNRGMMYRDLKPENIGFDIRDDVKLFDFGLVKELHDNMKEADGTYKLTEMTGSPRYMAPEVAMGLPYNQTCDSYSFAVLLWQMLSCKEPYDQYNMRLLRERVWTGPHKRLPIEEEWPVPVKLLIKRSWSQDLNERNRIQNIGAILRKECVRMRDGDDSGLEHQKRRSTFVFRPKKNTVDRGGVESAAF